MLRIEDTDRARSTQEAIDAILQDMKWLQLDYDEPEVYQFARAEHHAACAQKLLDEGKAYKCYCTPEELQAMRDLAMKEKRSPKYDGRCRNAPAQDKPFAVRLKMPDEGATTIKDMVQGEITIDNSQLDDMILLRADGTPTYMLSVVIDDHDMGVTHIIRGDDHLTNAFRQYQLYKAMGWDVPEFGHIPLIHSPDGKKLSKRTGAIGIEEYKDMGILPDAFNNYMLRLGWGHGDDEIISRQQAIEWFDEKGLGKAAPKYDLTKMISLNAHYLRDLDDAALLEMMLPFMQQSVPDSLKKRLLKGLPGLKTRAETLVQLAENAAFYVASVPLDFDEKARKFLNDDTKPVISDFADALEAHQDWSEAAIEQLARDFAEQKDLKLGKLAQPLRAALTGRTVSPSVFDILAVLGKKESVLRLRSAAD